MTSIAAATIWARRPVSVKEGPVLRSFCLAVLFFACMSKKVARFAQPSKTLGAGTEPSGRRAREHGRTGRARGGALRVVLEAVAPGGEAPRPPGSNTAVLT
ncbi:hypothetical protein Sgleb_21050 [Streptomyces glebosus]|uniref:Uncharacterized protein n=1 Tax=Streptomyces glebosus TaxID=249580 RepID=A0A640SSQ5_9ACTN|nr:hypothetical protein Sgleb_21050 [Streptomyces glebosus]GHG87162.1 hypothetical protein GCM10010513_68730 [Streptomyces glebosus]